VADVFISHSSIDHVVAEQLCANLEANGISCWMAPRDIKPGEEWARAINNAITAASVFIVIYSANSCQSTQVPKEIGLAGARNIYIVPYKIDNTPLTGEFEYYLLGSHWITADIDKNDFKINELYNTIFPLIRKSHDINDCGTTFINQLHIDTVNTTAAPQPQPPKKKKSMIPLVAILSALVLVVGVGIGFVASRLSSNDNDNDDDRRHSYSEDDDDDERSSRDEDEEDDNDITASASSSHSSDYTSSDSSTEYVVGDIWDGSSDTSWYDEDAISFEIYTAEQLAGLAKLVSSGYDMEGKTFSLAADIYLNDTTNYENWLEQPPDKTWTPIGNIGMGDSYYPFSGTFYGNGYSIHGIYAKTQRSAGLFSYLSKGHVSGVIIEESCIIAQSTENPTFAGAVAGASCDSVIECCENRSNIHSLASEEYINGDEAAYAGGITGIQFSSENFDSKMDECRISSCINSGEIYSRGYTYSLSGGVVGLAEFGIIENSLNTSYYSAYSYNDPCVGDIAGGISYCSVNNCYFRSDSEEDVGIGLVVDEAFPDTTIKISTDTYVTPEFVQRLGDDFIYISGEYAGPYLAIEN